MENSTSHEGAVESDARTGEGTTPTPQGDGDPREPSATEEAPKTDTAGEE